jgi:coatomer subunit beta'
MYILGYLAGNNRVYLTDKDMGVTSYLFPQGFIEYQTAVLAGNMDEAHRLLPSLTDEQRNKAALFLETRGLFGDLAMRKWRFDLAEQCLDASGDFDALLMFYQAKGDFAGMSRLAERAGLFDIL